MKGRVFGLALFLCPKDFCKPLNDAHISRAASHCRGMRAEDVWQMALMGSSAVELQVAGSIPAPPARGKRRLCMTAADVLGRSQCGWTLVPASQNFPVQLIPNTPEAKPHAPTLTSREAVNDAQPTANRGMDK